MIDFGIVVIVIDLVFGNAMMYDDGDDVLEARRSLDAD